METNELFVPELHWKLKVTPASCSAEQVSTDGPIEPLKTVRLASHLQLARSLNLWHVLAGTVNKLKLPLQANPALYMSSQLWTCHLFLLYGIFKSIEKVFYPVFFLLFLFFPSPIFWTLAHRQIIQAFSDFEKKAERKERDTLTGFPFVRLMVWGRRMEWVQGEGAGYKTGVSVMGAGTSNGCPPLHPP